MLSSEANKSMHRPHDEIPIGEAAWDVVEAGQRVLIDRVELLLLEMRDFVARVERQAAAGALALVLLVVAWIALNCTAAMALSGYMSAVAVGGLLTAVNTALGVGALLYATQSGSGSK